MWKDDRITWNVISTLTFTLRIVLLNSSIPTTMISTHKVNNDKCGVEGNQLELTIILWSWVIPLKIQNHQLGRRYSLRWARGGGVPHPWACMRDCLRTDGRGWAYGLVTLRSCHYRILQAANTYLPNGGPLLVTVCIWNKIFTKM